MIVGRAAALRVSSVNTFVRSSRTLRSRASQQCLRLSQQTGRREYSSAKDTVKKASSDIPWLASAIAVTIGGTYAALLPRSAPHDDHHDEHHEGHGQEKKESHEEESVEESSNEEDKAEEIEEEKPSDDGEKEDVPKEDAPKEEASKEEASKDESPKKEKAEKKSEETDDSAKAQGIVNDKKHSTNVHENPEKSKKGEGVIETARINRPVDPDRTQV